MHLGKGCEVRGVAEIVGVAAPGEARARRGLDGDDAHVPAAAQLRAQEREDDAGEVGAAAGAADDDVRVVVGELELRDRLLPDHRLVQQHVIQHRAQRVLGVIAARGDLDRLRDRDTEAARVLRVLRQDGAPGLRLVRGRGHAARAVGFHERAPVRLLVVGDAHHEYLHVDAEERTGERERGAPLSRAGLGRDALHPGFDVVERLRHRGVGLVAAGRAHALVLVVDARRRLQHLLEPARAVQRGRAPLLVDFANRARDLYLTLGRDLLRDQRHREERREIIRAHRLLRARVEHRGRRRRQVRQYVVPGARDS